MQQKQRKEKLIIVFVWIDKIVKNQCEKYDHNTSQRSCESLAEFDQPRAAENILVKTSNVINDNPKNGNKHKPKEKTIVEFNRNLDPKTLGFDYSFSVYKK